MYREVKDDQKKRGKTKILAQSKQSKNILNTQSQLILGCQPSLPTMMDTQSQSSIPRRCSISPAHQVRRLLLVGEKSSSEAFRDLLAIYQKNPQIYMQKDIGMKQSSQGQVRLLFPLTRMIIEHCQDFPFFEREKTIEIFEDMVKLVSQSDSELSLDEMKEIQQTNILLWKKALRPEIDRIIENAVIYFLKMVVSIGKKGKFLSQIIFAQTLIQSNQRQLIQALEKQRQNKSIFQELIFNFFRESLDILASITTQNRFSLPLFDLLALSISSPHSCTYESMVSYLFNLMKSKLQDKKGQEAGSPEESESLIRVLFMTANVFTFESLFSNSAQKVFYSKEVVFLIFHHYRGSFMRIIDEFQKIERSSIQRHIVRSMFEMAALGNSINQSQELKSIISHILLLPELKKKLKIDLLEGEGKLQQDPLAGMVKVSEKQLFQLFYRIQKNLSHYNFDHYMDLYVESPQTFRSEYFIENLFRSQTNQNILNFMIKLTRKWILVEMKVFDFNFYLMQFLKKCVRKDTIHLIGRYVKELEVEELLKISLILFKLSFEEDKKKIGIPESNDWLYQLAHLTSVGFAERFILINKIFPDFSQQLVWKQTIGFIQPSINYFYVKAFYNVVNYELNFGDFCLENALKMIDVFQDAIGKEKIEEVYSIFHLLTCIFFKREDPSTLSYQNKWKCEQRVLIIILTKSDELLNLCKEVCERRRTAMNHVILSTEMMNQNIRYFQKVKRMHSFFLKNLTKWMERLRNIDRMIGRVKTYEQVIELYMKLTKEVEFPQYHLLRTLSNVCSERYFSNILELKVLQKVNNREPLSTHRLLLLREIIFNMMEIYIPETQPNHYPLTQMQILNHFKLVLTIKLTATNEREVLKQKLIVLDIFYEVTNFFSLFSVHPLYAEYKQLYDQSFRLIIMQIATQNSEYVSKYQRELIVYLRTAALKQVLAFMGTPFQVISQQDCFGLVYELCFDKLLEIRLFVLNLFVSRFKNERFRCFLSHKYHITVYLTIFSIFEPNPILNATAKRALQTIKKAGEDQCCLSLVILLYTLKLMLNDILNGLHREQYHINVDFFIKNFDVLWLPKKEWQIAIYSFCEKYIVDRTMSLITSQYKYKSHIQTYITARQKSDYILQSEIKEYLRSDFGFQFPPDEPQPDLRTKYIEIIMRTLPFRVFQRLKLVIKGKPRSSRTLRGKKDIKIDWRTLEEESLVCFHADTVERESIKLTLN